MNSGEHQNNTQHADVCVYMPLEKSSNYQYMCTYVEMYVCMDMYGYMD